jgi:hypothetical protein
LPKKSEGFPLLRRIKGWKAQIRAKQKKKQHMKKLTYPLITAVAGLLVASASSALAGGTASCCSASCCNDGIAASPKVQNTLEERCLSKCTAPAQVTAGTITPQALVAGSPKAQQMRSNPTTVVQIAPETAWYQTTGSDGISASPKVRAMLNERSQAVQLAPLK